MPEIKDLIPLVQFDVVQQMLIIAVIVQLVAAIMGPAFLNFVLVAALGGLIAVGVSTGRFLQGGPTPQEPELYAQLLEFALVAVGVIVAHIIIRAIFRSMARASGVRSA
jgi:hypothetical protein